MFKTVAKLSTLLAALAFAPLASAAPAAPAAPAEEKNASGPTHIGIGIGINTQEGADIYVPIDMGAFRLEPSLGIVRVSYDNNGGSSSAVNLGCGFLFPIKAAKTVNVYAGGRLFLDFVSLDNGVTSDSGVDFTLAGALGAEWFADPRFSIGAEARLGFTIAATLDSGRNGYNALYTSGVAFLRFYL